VARFLYEKRVGTCIKFLVQKKLAQVSGTKFLQVSPL